METHLAVRVDGPTVRLYIGCTFRLQASQLAQLRTVQNVFMFFFPVLEVKPLSAMLNARRTDVPLSHAELHSMSTSKTKAIEDKPSSTPFRRK